ncbi:hypothetical protein OS493_000399 [Desmophyllum pertusum]|uniref:Myb/SANT-like DNA-binding domain-containing protein n=1 Tax=Desmophyllum pertusum TaxID=174260 RepID=A0A9X0A6Y4_9CNID|nr:hypothetical protein OS493_000399 [Desmophyllum pertusum]
MLCQRKNKFQATFAKETLAFTDKVPPSCSYIIPPGGYPDDRVFQHQGPYLFGRENADLMEFNPAPAPQFQLNTPAAYDFVPRESMAMGQTVQTGNRKKSAKSVAEQSRNRWTDGEVKLLIAIYGEEYQNRDKGRSLGPMWDRIANRLVAESKEINDFNCDKSAKNCRDKINNLNKSIRM